MQLPDVVRRAPVSPQLLTFLAVGGTGYVVDVAAFNLLRSTATLGAWDPSVARVLAVGAAMVVTYLGNSLFTWRRQSTGNRRREVTLFVVFNLIALGLSVLTLTVSHDVLGLTSRLADNLSANVVGLALGTMFRYWSYKTFVFTQHPESSEMDLLPVGVVERAQ
jgi:putative flippase GtrA